jgi:hypothetical protein
MRVGNCGQLRSYTLFILFLVTTLSWMGEFENEMVSFYLLAISSLFLFLVLSDRMLASYQRDLLHADLRMLVQ